MPMIQASAVPPALDNYLRVEASDGLTYAGVRDLLPRGKIEMLYCTWPTGSREPDTSIDFIRMPRSVRDLMRRKFAVNRNGNPRKEE